MLFTDPGTIILANSLQRILPFITGSETHSEPSSWQSLSLRFSFAFDLRASGRTFGDPSRLRSPSISSKLVCRTALPFPQEVNMQPRFPPPSLHISPNLLVNVIYPSSPSYLGTGKCHFPQERLGEICRTVRQKKSGSNTLTPSVGNELTSKSSILELPSNLLMSIDRALLTARSRRIPNKRSTIRRHSSESVGPTRGRHEGIPRRVPFSNLRWPYGVSTEGLYRGSLPRVPSASLRQPPCSLGDSDSDHFGPPIVVTSSSSW